MTRLLFAQSRDDSIVLDVVARGEHPDDGKRRPSRVVMPGIDNDGDGAE